MNNLAWLIELEVDFAQWRRLVGGPSDIEERRRWLVMCHRLGSTAAKTIVGKHRRRNQRKD